MGKDLICMKIRQIKSLISDARYLSIIKVLLKHDNILAIYFIRLTIGFNLTVSKKLIRKIVDILPALKGRGFQASRLGFRVSLPIAAKNVVLRWSSIDSARRNCLSSSQNIFRSINVSQVVSAAAATRPLPCF